MPKIKLVSSDLNGTLVHQHTMSDMIRLYLSQEAFEKADEVFKRQTAGKASMEAAFGIAGPLTRGLTLRQAIEYTRDHMHYVNGFHEFVYALAENDVPLVINSTGYSVTIHAIRAQLGFDRIEGQIGNYLRFGWNGDVKETLREDELCVKVREYFVDGGDETYDKIQATGEIELGILNEEAKAELIIEYAKKHLDIWPEEIAHMGDTMGDRGGIKEISEAGGIGIAFNYNKALEDYLNRVKVGTVFFVDEKSETSDLRNVIPLLV